MGRPVKLSDQNKAWFLRRLRCRERILDVSAERQRFLIVCEGAKTEPNYFAAFRMFLPRHLVELDISGEGANTLSLVSRAEALRDRRAAGDLPYDQVWVVFDRDSFAADDFDNAIHKAEADRIKCAWTNEAFEFWYVLHFEYRTTAMTRNEYEGKLTTLLKQEYKKNAPDMFQQLAEKGNQTQAINGARRLHGEVTVAQTPPSQANPCTTVYELVEALNRFRKPPQPGADE